MSRRSVMGFLWAAAVLTALAFANRSNARGFYDPDAPLGRNEIQVRVVWGDASTEYYVACADALCPQRIAVLQCIVEENDDPKLDCQISTRPSVQPKDFLGWKEFPRGIDAAPRHYGPVPGAVRLSPAKFVQIRHGLLRGTRPLLTLRVTRTVTEICYRGFLDVGGSISSALAADETFSCYEVVRIDDVTAAEDEMKPSDEPIIPIYAEDEGQPFSSYDFPEDYWALFPKRLKSEPPSMPLDSPNWVVPGAMTLHLLFRPIPSRNSPHVAEQYVFAKPNGDIIAFNKKMAKAETKAAEGTARKASAKRYRETDEVSACVGKGE